MERNDVRVREPRHGFRFALESRKPVGTGGNIFWQDVDGDVAIQPRVTRAVDLAHTTHTDGSGNSMGTETSTGGQRHCYGAVVSYAPACVTDGGVMEKSPMLMRLPA